MGENLSRLSGRKGLEENLFEKIVDSSKESGAPDREKLKSLAREYLMGEANTYGAASFYDFLKEENLGKKAYVCSGSACLLAGTQDNVYQELEVHFSEGEIGHMCCLGRCHENSAFQYDGHNYSGKSIENLETVLWDKPNDEEQYFVGGNMESPLLTSKIEDLNLFYSAFSEAISRGKDQVLEDLKKSDLRGRGGAGFPMGMKLEFCKNTPSDQKFIVCNADEGDPGAYSDRYLLEERPHLILFGMMVAGFITGANRGVFYIRAEYPESVSRVKKAVEELEELGFHGENIQGSGFDFRFKILEGAGAYICGEETALLSSIEGQRPEVRVRPPFPAQEGLFMKPTVVNNVETLAMVYHVLKMGGEDFSKMGRGKSTGSKLVCLDSHFNRPGLYEVLMGTPLEEVLFELGKGFKVPVKAIHVGGPLGGIIPVEKFGELSLDFESFADEGFLLGHASILAIPESFPMIKYLEHLFEFTANESCGKCFPCSIGSVRGMEMLRRSQNGDENKIDRKLMNDLLETLEIGSLCALGGGLPLGIKNALNYFEDELNPFFQS
jgi:NADH:ubiquinone oxidoreductase subunit F (NADH-binding)/NADH:ubiquinone oxidoreductase subunit E